jgi:PGF-CTERM protein
MIEAPDGAARSVLFASVLVVLMALCAGTGTVAAQSAPDCSTVSYSGAGTELTPYLVSNVNELQCIEEQDLGANYVQVSDIDASGTSSWNGGDGFAPIREPLAGFTGNFDGAKHTISGLTIDRRSTGFVGLFGDLEPGGRIENVSLKNADITGEDFVGGLVGNNVDGTVTESYATGDVSGTSNVGGLAGANSGIINKSYATGNVSGSGDKKNVGGLVGENQPSATVRESYATGDVSGRREVGGLVGENRGIVNESHANASVSGDFRVGGLVGANDGTVTESYVTSSISGSSNVGGLAGANSGTVTESYATGGVSGDDFVGGLVGRNLRGLVTESYATGSVNGTDGGGGLVGTSEGTVRESYWDTESTRRATSVGGTGLTTSEMTGNAAARNMQGFNFMTTWETVNGDYPKLKWQSDSGDGRSSDGDDGSSDSTDSTDDGKSDSSDGGEGEGLPGFTAVTAMFALLTVVAAAVRRRKE